MWKVYDYREQQRKVKLMTTLDNDEMLS